MSKVKLNSINIIKSTATDTDFIYLGGVFRAPSGYDKPVMIRSTEEMRAIFGDFTDFRFYESLLKQGYTLCLQAVQTEASKYNKCSLRLNQLDSDIITCFPKSGLAYHNIEIPNDLRFIKEFSDDLKTEDKYLSAILDFTNLSNEFLQEITADDYLVTHYLLFNYEIKKDSGPVDSLMNHNYLICNKPIENGLTEIPSNYYDSFGDVGNEAIWLTGDKSVYNRHDALENIISQVEDKTFTAKSIVDIIIEFIDYYYTQFGSPEKDYLGNFVDIEDWIDDVRSKALQYDFILETSTTASTWIFNILNSALQCSSSFDQQSICDDVRGTQKFVDFIYIYFATEVNESLKDYLENNYEDTNELRNYQIGLFENYTVNSLNETLEYLRSNNIPIIRYSKILFQFETPVQDVNYQSFPFIDYYRSFRRTQDVLSKYTDDHKLIEFYSKIRGPRGHHIDITIKEDPEFDKVYYIDINTETQIESYSVYTTNQKPENCHKDLVHFSEISRLSNLVDMRIYDYWMGPELEGDSTSDNYLVDSRYVDFTETDYFENNIRDEEDFELPTGSFNLNRYLYENYTTEDLINTLNQFRYYGYYPDLFMVPTIESQEHLNAIAELVGNTVTDENTEPAQASIFSQALIGLDFRWVNPSALNLITKDNRLLYFYGNVLTNLGSLPSLIEYVPELMTQTYLEYPVDQFLSRPFDMAPGGDILLEYIDEVKRYKVISILSVDDWDENSSRVEYCEYDPSSNSMEFKFGKWTTNGIDQKKDIFYCDYDFESDSMIDTTTYLISDLEQFIDSKKINNIKSDNLKYYWENIKELSNQKSVFMIRFITSKYAREIYKLNHRLSTRSMDTLNSIIAVVNSNCQKFLTLVDSSTYTLTRVNPDAVQVSFNIQISSLTNKTFTLNILLNS